jgi:hypothetical protein
MTVAHRPVMGDLEHGDGNHGQWNPRGIACGLRLCCRTTGRKAEEKEREECREKEVENSWQIGMRSRTNTD